MRSRVPTQDNIAVDRLTVLLGNPNVGKSVLFRNLTNHYVTGANFPGTTVEIVRARANFNGRTHEIIDSPGINDLTHGLFTSGPKRWGAAQVADRILAVLKEA